MARLDEVGDRDGWRCWICDDAVDPDMSVNDPRGPSVDSAGVVTLEIGSPGGTNVASFDGPRSTRTSAPRIIDVAAY